MDKTDFFIIGGGVVGLAIAAELAARFHERSIVLFERHQKFGRETSSRNSEVLHAGIYYSEGSLKAGLCVKGIRLLYDFCSKLDVPHKRSGKLIVADTEEEILSLESLMVRGRENGVGDLQFLDSAQISELEPNIQATAAIFSPSTGIVDSHQLMSRLEWLAGKGGAIMAYQHEVIEIDPAGNRHVVFYRGPNGSQGSIQSTWLINSAGLSADHIASLLGIDIDAAGYRLCPCKGEYFSIPYSKSKLISRLIYPPPFKDMRGLGVHLTKTLDGGAKLGPNAFYVEDLDYNIDSQHADCFYNSLKGYMPFLEKNDLQPDMAGIRPKLQPPNSPVRDFVICHETKRGLDRVINLIGIESPGLTCCLSLAGMVADLIERQGC